MAFTPTPRRAGQDMVTIRVRFDLDGTMLAKILAANAFDDATDYGTNLEASISRAKAEEKVRAFLGYHGGDDDPLDGWDDDDIAEHLSWATEQVKRLWPSMTVRES